jgi:cytochrome c oxidase subunit 3
MASDSTAVAHADSHGHDHGHADPAYKLAHHFDTPVQQFEAAKIGVWMFLSQEILFFSGLFVAYFIYRAWYPAAFSVGSHMLDWKLGFLNTIVLLFSSYTAAQAVRYAQLGERKQVGNMILITIACAFIFMVIKAFEYHHKFELGTLPGHFFDLTHHGEEAVREAAAVSHIGDFEPYHLRSFFGIYFIMTGVHGLHVVIGIGIFTWMYLRNARGEFSDKFFTPIDLSALYWHLVDLIWIFLFPLVYLID